MVLLALITIGLSNAYADDHCVRTEQETPTGTEIRMVCQWDLFIPRDGADDTGGPTDPDGIPDGTPEPDDGQPPTPDGKPHPDPNCELDPEIDLNGDCVIDAAEKYKDDKKNFCLEKKQKPSQIEACRLMEDLTPCWRGVDETQPIQKFESFITSRGIPDLEKAWNLGTTNLLTKLKLAMEDCIAQEEKLPGMLGPRYENMRLATIFDGAIYHADNPTAKVAEAITWIQEVYTGAILTDEHLVLEAQTAFYNMCNLTQIADSTKKEMDCPAKEYDDTVYYQFSRLDLDRAKNEVSMQYNAAMNKFDKYDETDGMDFNEDIIVFKTFGNWTGLE